jgi:nucleoside-diphosphate-sugar epimerase
MKTALILGGSGFIGSNLGIRLKKEGYWVRSVDIKEKNEFLESSEFCDEYVCGDLRDPSVVSKVMYAPNQLSLDDKENSFDMVFALAALMGGALYIFSKEGDADIMHDSALINLNVAHEAVKKNIKKLFWSSSACVYNEDNQTDPNNPNCEESSAYPAKPDSSYGWEKIFSEQLYQAYARNYGLNVYIARFHNIFGPMGTFSGGKEKFPAAVSRKVSECIDGGTIQLLGDGCQTRSFLYIDECLEAVLRFMNSDFHGPVNIGSEEMISINQLAQMVIDISGKNIKIHNVTADEYYKLYQKTLPEGVRGRNSDNRLYQQHMNWTVSQPLRIGMEKTYEWINKQVNG